MPENECWKTEDKIFWQFEKMFLKNEFCRMLFCRIKMFLKKNIGQSKIGYLSFYSNSKKAKTFKL